ncbi:DUF2827 domain-containing protein [Burkholderia cepacia]|uniref:DUF2827 domain-containing protein n=1 Tax=Burkholderia cepacia TaxID=292 RepID=A0A2S8I9L3_BURCE|nr:DUF2827 family protein [Burkholderia cepacia]PQP11428.1 DUF2827 domain-containing protein [Burkholderia cepacia]HDR9511019.1 DUF2827 family protein [Burkholderia cepacia]
MRVGLSIQTYAGQSIWASGLSQQVIFLGRLLRALPMVKDVVLLNSGDPTPIPAEAQAAGIDWPLLHPRDATDRVDVVIEAGGALDVEWLDYVRALGKKVVLMCYGQPYTGLIEPMLFKRDGYFSRPTRCDEVWILPKDREMRAMLETLHRAPVFEVPFVWDPVFVEQRAASIAQAGFPFGYQPADRSEADAAPRALRVAIFEPNTTVLRNCTIPLLIGERAYRDEPDTLENLQVLNSVHIKAHPTFIYLMQSLSLYQRGKIYLDQRHDLVGYMSQFADAVVSHQWQHDQNMLHLDVLYGGYPLIHNSRWLAEVGYYYPESEVGVGARRLRDAAHHHDLHFDHNQRETRAFLARLHPGTSENRAAYAQRLLRVSARAIRGLPC